MQRLVTWFAGALAALFFAFAAHAQQPPLKIVFGLGFRPIAVSK